MNISLKTNKGEEIKLGDKIELLRFCDDSGTACDLYGVEPQLDGWINVSYIENYQGEVIFCEEKMMVVVRCKNVDIPLSKEIRYNMYLNIYENIIQEEDLKISKEENNLIDIEYETFIEFLVKL